MNGQNHSYSGSHHPVKKLPPAKVSIPLSSPSPAENFSHLLKLFWKPCSVQYQHVHKLEVLFTTYLNLNHQTREQLVVQILLSPQLCSWNQNPSTYRQAFFSSTISRKIWAKPILDLIYINNTNFVLIS